MHGSWLPPIGETTMGIAVALVVCGIITSCSPQLKTQRELDPEQRRVERQALIILLLDIIFGPLICQIFVMMKLKILCILTFQTCPWLPCLPFVRQALQKNKARKRSFEECVARSTKKWNSYCEGFAPDSNSAIHSGSFSMGRPTTVDSNPFTI